MKNKAAKKENYVPASSYAVRVKKEESQEEKDVRMADAMLVVKKKDHSVDKKDRIGKGRSRLTKQQEAVRKIISFSDRFVRDPNGFNPKSHNREKQVREFITHVFCEYPVPKFLYAVWLGYRQEEYIDYFFCAARGGSVYNECTMDKLTRKETHDFMNNSKPGMTIYENLWRAKIAGLGGDGNTQDLFISTDRINGMPFTPFWEDVIRFFSKNEVSRDDFLQIMDFLIHRHRVDDEFSMKGRSLNSVEKLSSDWHREMIVNRLAAENVPILDMELPKWFFKRKVKNGVEEVEEMWTIRQLKTPKELVAEGRMMRHCVGSYVNSCRNGYSAIFSLAVEDIFGNTMPKVTIEVSPRRNTIVQAKRKFNDKPSNMEWSIIARWATRYGFSF